MKNTLIAVAALAILAFLGYEGCSRIQKTDKEFKATLDSLHKANDSLIWLNDKADATIDQYVMIDSLLQKQLENQKVKVVTVTKFIDSSKKAINTYSEVELVSSLNKRYPADTVTNPLPVAQPVLVSVAKDLVELDGTKEILAIKDSIIVLQEDRISKKDTVINLYAFKEQNYKKILTNKDLEIKNWAIQYNQLQLQNTKLRLKNKVTRIGAGLVVGGLVYLMIAK